MYSIATSPKLCANCAARAHCNVKGLASKSLCSKWLQMYHNLNFGGSPLHGDFLLQLLAVCNLVL